LACTANSTSDAWPSYSSHALGIRIPRELPILIIGAFNVTFMATTSTLPT
jgi:hypothetical protein